MSISIVLADCAPSNNHSLTIAKLVIALTEEICKQTQKQHFTIDLKETTTRCQTLMEQGVYHAFIAYSQQQVIGVVTISETYALYAAGKIGIIQECYVIPEFRGQGIGEQLIKAAQAYGEKQNWACMELCTPPLPEFQRSIHFYEKSGLKVVGGRKMRKNLSN